MAGIEPEEYTSAKRSYYGGYSSSSNSGPYFVPVDPSPEDLEWSWTWDRTVKSLVLIPIVLGTILGNFLVLYAFATRRRDLRSPTHCFVANLALADFLVGVLVLPFLATLNITDRWYFGQGFCTAWVCIHFWLCSSSILSTCVVCIERYIGVRFPLKHLSILSKPRILGMVCGVWSLAGFLSIVPVFAWPEPPSNKEYFCQINQQIGHVIVATLGILYIPAIIMIVLYWRIFTIASRHLRACKKGVDNVGSFSYSSAEGGKTRYQSEISGTESTSCPDQVNDGQNGKCHDGQNGNGHNGLNGKGHNSENGKGCNDENGKFHNGESGKGHNVNGQKYKIQNGLKNNLTKSQSDLKKASNDSSNSSTSVNLNMNSGQSGTSQSPLVTASSSKQILLAKRLIILVGSLLISYVPFFTMFLIRAFSPEAVPLNVFIAFGWIRYFNSCINPVIYAFAVPAYKKAFRSIFSWGKL